MNPIPDLATGQRLLDTAYQAEGKSWKANYYNGHVLKFRSSGDGFWHAYELENEISHELKGTNILKQFNLDGLISNSEYKKLLKK